MYGNMTLGALIEWLEQQDQALVVRDGFGSPHSDRGSYDELAFSPLPEARVGDMLAHARSAVNATFHGWKGGEFKMGLHTSVYIGEYGECGDAITPTHFKYWLMAATPTPASQSTDPRAQFDSSGKLIAYDARGGGMYGPFPASQSSTNSPETDSKLVGEDASQSAPSAGGGELHAALCFLGELETVGNTRAAEIARGLRRLATAGQGVEDLREIARLIGTIFYYGSFKAETHAERALESLLRANGFFYETEQAVFDAAPTPEQRG